MEERFKEKKIREKKKEKNLLVFCKLLEAWKVGKILLKPESHARSSYLALKGSYFSILLFFKLSVFGKVKGRDNQQ